MTLIAKQVLFKSPCLRTPDLMSLLTINLKKKKTYQLNMRNYLLLICFLLTNLRHREKFLCTTTDL